MDNKEGEEEEEEEEERWCMECLERRIKADYNQKLNFVYGLSPHYSPLPFASSAVVQVLFSFLFLTVFQSYTYWASLASLCFFFYCLLVFNYYYYSINPESSSYPVGMEKERLRRPLHHLLNL